MARKSRQAAAEADAGPTPLADSVDQVIEGAQAAQTATGSDVFDQATAAQQQAAAAPAATREPSGDGEEQAAGQATPRRKWTPPADPFGFENRDGDGNRVRLLKG